jgi:predicted phage tail protein
MSSLFQILIGLCLVSGSFIYTLTTYAITNISPLIIFMIGVSFISIGIIKASNARISKVMDKKIDKLPR